MAQAVIDSSGAQSRTQKLISLIRLAAEAAVPVAGTAMLMVAAERAPSIDEEYNELNAEAGSAPLVGRSGDTSADSDERVRFIKPESTYLKNAVGNPENMQVSKNLVRVGNITYLKSMTHFKYKNVGAHGGTITNEVGPYFTMFEGGTAGAAVNEGGITTFTVQPRGDWPLRPGEGSEGIRKTMIKSIRARAMFLPLYLQRAARAVFDRVLSEVGPGHAAS